MIKWLQFQGSFRNIDNEVDIIFQDLNLIFSHHTFLLLYIRISLKDVWLNFTSLHPFISLHLPTRSLLVHIYNHFFS